MGQIMGKLELSKLGRFSTVDPSRSRLINERKRWLKSKARQKRGN